MGDPNGAARGVLTAAELRCERVVDPLGVGEQNPVFSWVPVAAGGAETQTAYRVLVATDPSRLSEGTADLWDSGPVESDAVSGVAYGGPALSSRTRAWWSVQLWDRTGEAGPVSASASFEMGLLRADDWGATWIGGAVGEAAPLLRTEFSIDGEVRSARAYVTGLGYYELRLNGAKVGDRVLDPPLTTYDHFPELRDPQGNDVQVRSPRVIYTAFDVTDQVTAGANAVGVILGNGWYVGTPGAGFLHPWSDRARALVQLEVELTDGRRVVVVSDATWRTAAGPIVKNSPVDGEHYDARLEQAGWAEAGFDDSAWQSAEPIAAPAGALSSTTMEPVRVVETLAPVRTTAEREGLRVVDFGQHFSGWVRVRVSGPAGAEVTLRFAGDVDEAGELDTGANMLHVVPALQTDVVTLDGSGSLSWEPLFTLHGFQYVEVTYTDGVVLEQIEGRVVHSDIASVSTFSSSDELLNQIDRNVRWTFRSSFQGYPQDAADRGERAGWLGETGWIVEDYLYTFQGFAFWAKWLDDIRDSQLSNGRLPIVSPIQWSTPYGDWPDWTTTYPLLVWHLYYASGDRAILERHYEGIRELLDWYSSTAVDGVVSLGLGDHMEPGDDGLSDPFPQRTPVALTSTAWWFAITEITANVADVLGDTARAAELRAAAATIRDTFTATFFDPATARYGTGSQTSMALPLWLGLVPAEHRDAVAANLVADIIGRDGGHLGTGTMGTAALERVLTEVGAADVMYRIATQTDFPSWGNQIRQGATTVWETWGRGHLLTMNGKESLLRGSKNMKLLAEVSTFLIRDVAGLGPAAAGWQRIRVRPAVTNVMSHAESRVSTPRGVAAIAWRREGDRLEVDLEVPATSIAEVGLPVTGLREPVLRADGQALDVRRTGDEISVELGGGVYHLVLTDGDVDG
jgi:alpha-L-rhamnosidase